MHFRMTDTAVTLPSNWAAFVDRLILGDAPADAAALCGYASPKAAAAALVRHPQVRKALATAAEARLECEAVPLALDAVAEILKDQDPKRSAVRAKLALGVLDRVRSKEERESLGGKSLADMSPRELEQLVTQLGQSGVRPGEMRDVTPDKPSPNEP